MAAATCSGRWPRRKTRSVRRRFRDDAWSPRNRVRSVMIGVSTIPGQITDTPTPSCRQSARRHWDRASTPAFVVT
jgi:hypothetical protein